MNEFSQVFFIPSKAVFLGRRRLDKEWVQVKYLGLSNFSLSKPNYDIANNQVFSNSCGKMVNILDALKIEFLDAKLPISIHNLAYILMLDYRQGRMPSFKKIYISVCLEESLRLKIKIKILGRMVSRRKKWCRIDFDGKKIKRNIFFTDTQVEQKKLLEEYEEIFFNSASVKMVGPQSMELVEKIIAHFYFCCSV